MKMVIIKRLDAQKESSLAISLEPQPKGYYLPGKGRINFKTNNQAKEQLSKYQIRKVIGIELTGFHGGGLGGQKDRKIEEYASSESQDTHKEEGMGVYMLIN
jgi:hypothetical protein